VTAPALALREARVSRFSPRRLTASVWRQRARSLVCPATPRLDGRSALVTGGSEGVGLGTCRGLLQRGARVWMASRSQAKGERACEQLRSELGAAARVEFLPLDLSDLDRVRSFAADLGARLGGDPLDLLVCNAGLWPRRHRLSAQGHELAFATNVLGHHLLIRHLVPRALRAGARVVAVTGDIYILAGGCTPDYAYAGPLGGMQAYCRSKLGNIWLAQELQRRHPELRVRIAHPGVVATSLGGERRGVAAAVSRRLLLDVDRGAQATLVCATRDDLPPAAYLHNTLGIVRFAERDRASDARLAARLWERCEALCRGYLLA
jgi:NAD(P)-dependent dehydrogenase (short-subunit alcohol dehydrogenase family)